MSDPVVKKTILNYIHAAVRYVFHVILIPVILVLKLLVGWLSHTLNVLSEI